MSSIDRNVVFLRPSVWGGSAVDYVKSAEKAGMVVNQRNQLAIYTCIPGGGPQGPGGEDLIEVDDTIIASCSDELSEITASAVVAKTTFRAPYPFDMTNGYVRASLTQAPTGSAMSIDVKMNDPDNPGNPSVSIFSTPITIDAGEKTSVTAVTPSVLNIASIPDDAEFTVFVTAIGSTFAGSGLKVALTGKKVQSP